MQAPVAVAPAPPKLVTVAPAAVEASEAVTSLQASTLEISVAWELGDGEWLPDEEAEGEVDDPQAPIKKPAAATRSIAPICRTSAWPARLKLCPTAPKGTAPGCRNQIELPSADRITR